MTEILAVVHSPTQCTLDGVETGNVADTIANRPEAASPIQIALQLTWNKRDQEYASGYAELQKAHEQETQRQLNLLIEQHQANLTTLTQQHRDQIAALNQQIEELKNPPQPAQDWTQLVERLRGTNIWAKTFVAAERSTAANAAWTLLYGTLTRTQNLPDLEFAIFKMREAMGSLTGIGDFNSSEIEQIDLALSDSGFELQLQKPDTAASDRNPPPANTLATDAEPTL